MIKLNSELDELHPRIRIVGVGGGGGNAVANMLRGGARCVDFIAANTDAQALRTSPVDRLLQLGRRTTRGLGAGSSAEVGRAAAEESLAEIEEMLEGSQMCFIAAGMGGGTGTGAAPVIAEAARAKGILTVGVVTKPFAFEGERRARIAEAGLEALQRHVDTLIVIPNQNLFRIAGPETGFRQAFEMADEVLRQSVRGITDLVTLPGLINLDFADVCTVMTDRGRAMMGASEATGDSRALRAAEAAIANPLLDEAIRGASGLIISIIGGDDLGLMEVDEAACHIKDQVDPDAEIIWGSAFDPELDGRVRVSVIAAGLDGGRGAAAAMRAEAATAPAEQAGPAAAEQAELPLAFPAPATGETVDGQRPATPKRQVEPIALAAAPPRRPPLESPPVRGPSLFDRMASAARGAVVGRRGDVPPLAPLRPTGTDLVH